MKYFVFDEYNGDLYTANNDDELKATYQELISTLGGVDAFNENCTVVRGGTKVNVSLGIVVDDGKQKPNYRDSAPRGGYQRHRNVKNS